MARNKGKKGRKAKKAKGQSGKNGNTSNGDGFQQGRLLSAQRPPRAARSRGTAAAHVQATCSVTNPFCAAAKAAGRPDGLGGNCMRLQVRGFSTVTTDSSGAAFFVLVPGLGRYGYANGALATGTWTLAAAWSTLNGSSLISTYASEIRIVSMGAVVRTVGSATTSSGILTVASMQNPTVSSTYAQGSLIYPEAQVHTMGTNTELSWIAKPIGASAHTFKQLSGVTSTMSDFDWTSLVVEIQGGTASTALLSIEYVVNVEFTLAAVGGATALAPLLPPPRPPNPVALHAQNTVLSSASSFIQGGIDAAEKTVTKFASDAVADVMSSVGAWFML